MPGGGGRIDSPNINQTVVATRPPVEPADDDLSSLLKADLVERAEAAGIDTTGLTKADLVAALEST